MENNLDNRQGSDSVTGSGVKSEFNSDTKSFSRMVKEEIFRAGADDMCCVKAEFSGLLLFGTQWIQKDGIKITTENPDVVGCFAELARMLGLEAEVRQNTEKSVKYTAQISDTVKVAQLLYDLNLLDETDGCIKYHVSRDITQKMCCKRAFVRGAFMGAGTISDPSKNYNMEIITPRKQLCEETAELMRSLDFECKVITRKNKYVIYIKNSDRIADILSFLGAYKSQMELLNIKIEKEIRNDLNRTANSETSNLIKTINASVEQIQAIQKIDKLIGLDSLPDELREIALLRLKNKDLSLSELGGLLNPPLTKSGVNHRMKKILNYVE